MRWKSAKKKQTNNNNNNKKKGVCKEAENALYSF